MPPFYDNTGEFLAEGDVPDLVQRVRVQQWPRIHAASWSAGSCVATRHRRAATGRSRGIGWLRHTGFDLVGLGEAEAILAGNFPTKILLFTRRTFQGDMSPAGLAWWDYMPYTESAYATEL